MKWLDELKVIRSLVPPEAIPMNIMLMPVDMVDRLIAIAEQVEWIDFMEGDWCPICGAEAPPGGPHAHYGDCPYHDDWRKE